LFLRALSAFAGEGQEGPGLDIDLIRDAYQGILELYNPEVVKKIGAAMVRLLDGLDKHMDKVPETRWLRVLLIILQSPLIGEKGVGDQVSTRLFAIYLRIQSSSEKVSILEHLPSDCYLCLNCPVTVSALTGDISLAVFDIE
jgi:hypothetical protein